MSEEFNSLMRGLGKIEAALNQTMSERDTFRQRLEIHEMVETCTQCHKGWHPSLVESGWCIFCILKEKNTQLATRTAERDYFRKLIIELEQCATKLVQVYDVDNRPDDYSEIWEARRALGKLQT